MNNMFLRMAPPFLLSLSKNRNTATNNISKQDLEVASMLGLTFTNKLLVKGKVTVFFQKSNI